MLLPEWQLHRLLYSALCRRGISNQELGGTPHDDIGQQPEPNDHARKYCGVLPDIHIWKSLQTWYAYIGGWFGVHRGEGGISPVCCEACRDKGVNIISILLLHLFPSDSNVHSSKEPLQTKTPLVVLNTRALFSFEMMYYSGILSILTVQCKYIMFSSENVRR